MPETAAPTQGSREKEKRATAKKAQGGAPGPRFGVAYTVEIWNISRYIFPSFTGDQSSRAIIWTIQRPERSPWYPDSPNSALMFLHRAVPSSKGLGKIP